MTLNHPPQCVRPFYDDNTLNPLTDAVTKDKVQCFGGGNFFFGRCDHLYQALSVVLLEMTMMICCVELDFVNNFATGIRYFSFHPMMSEQRISQDKKLHRRIEVSKITNIDVQGKLQTLSGKLQTTNIDGPCGKNTNFDGHILGKIQIFTVKCRKSYN